MRVMQVVTVVRSCVTWYQTVAAMVNVWNLTFVPVIVDTLDLSVYYSHVKLRINVQVTENILLKLKLKQFKQYYYTISHIHGSHYKDRRKRCRTFCIYQAWKGMEFFAIVEPWT